LNAKFAETPALTRRADRNIEYNTRCGLKPFGRKPKKAVNFKFAEALAL
jgi:hypothetical protein